MNTPNVDYHLLRCFDALLRDKSVSKAARRVGLSQPAMSHALARLREMLGDPLLVRAGREMMLTPRAEELAEPLRLALEGLERVTRTEPAFDPSESRQRFVVQASDGAALSLLPSVVAEVQR
ncbi:MAG: LysR family transcriptional regulator, partial [Deltaproteobacteria bacterium]|nr:LysR family transcriptional regulator [Deltaproteobacteria bacterium]